MKYQITFREESFLTGELDEEISKIVDEELTEKMKDQLDGETYSITIAVRNFKKEKVKMDKSDKVLVEVIQK